MVQRLALLLLIKGHLTIHGLDRFRLTFPALACNLRDLLVALVTILRDNQRMYTCAIKDEAVGRSLILPFITPLLSSLLLQGRVRLDIDTNKRLWTGYDRSDAVDELDGLSVG